VTDTGTVYLIGAGPGDPDLITVKGLRTLQEADVILYDRLAPAELLVQAKPDAELIDVGKQPKHHTLTQHEINVCMIERAQQGKMVARLKGGDPFVFGRGGEEAEACRAAGVPFVVVPGITSAIGVPAYAGIPLTHRDFSSAFLVTTGHENPDKESSSLDYAVLAQIETLVFLMAVGNLPKIATRLIDAGRDPLTPVACIENGTLSNQRTITGTLSTIGEVATQAKLRAPAVIVIGDVAGLYEKLRW
jgi:uroporphyrinogen III methyltransferase/synthase